MTTTIKRYPPAGQDTTLETAVHGRPFFIKVKNGKPPAHRREAAVLLYDRIVYFGGSCSRMGSDSVQIASRYYEFDGYLGPNDSITITGDSNG